MSSEIPAGHVEQHSSERAKQLMVVLIFAVLVLSVVFYLSYQRFSQISTTGTEVPQISQPAIAEVPKDAQPKISDFEKSTQTTNVVLLPGDLEKSHFGFVNAKQAYSEIHEFGIRWDRPFPGPFSWNVIGYTEFNFDATDDYVKKAQNAGFATLAIIWPYNDADQQACHGDYPQLDFRKYTEVATRTGLPCNDDAFAKFISALVERYDGDGVNDMLDLTYPIKYWEVASTPEVQDTGNGERYFTGDGYDYAKLLSETYDAIKSADAGANVLHGSIADTDGRSTLFWNAVYKSNPRFDIVSVQCTQSCDDEMKIKTYNNIVTKYIGGKPIWVTDVAYVDAADDDQAKNLFKGHINAFGSGVQKVFYDTWRITGGGKKQLAALNTQTEKRKSYFALSAVINKVGALTAAEKINGGYKFKSQNKEVYAFLSSGELPLELQGAISITDYNGTTKVRQGAFNLFAGEVPSFVEKI